MAPDLPLFIYGTLRDADIVSAVLGHRIAVNALPEATAPDFAAVYYPGHAYPALVPRRGAGAPGLLLGPLSADDSLALDAFEGDQYRLASLEVLCLGALRPSLCYMPTSPIGPEAPVWTLEHWLTHHRPRVLAQELRAAVAGRRR